MTSNLIPTSRLIIILRILTRILQVLFVGSLAMIFSGIVFLIGSRVFYANRALPGILAAGVNLGGMTQVQIETTLSQVLTYPQTGMVVLRDGVAVQTARPAELGIIIDIPAMAQQAISVGRHGSLVQHFQEQIDAWYQGHLISPIIIFDQLAGSFHLQSRAEEIDRPTVEASLNVNGTEIEVHPGQIGRSLDIQTTLEVLAFPITQFHDTDMDLVIVETPPLVLDASQTAQIAREILSQPLTLTADGAGSWAIDPSDLAYNLRFSLVLDDDEPYYQVLIDPDALSAILEPLTPELERKPENARFIFNDDTGELDLMQAGVIGRSLDIPASVEAINAGLTAGQHQIPLTFIVEEPTVGDAATAEELGISEAVSVVSTYFSGSSTARISNIKTASGAFHGLLLAPGETLSMGDVLGDISLDNGYAEALIILGDRTIKGVGGGVCQVSTTLFRAVFFGGYQIDERHPHAYRVGYYEQGPGSPGTGLDATVFVPIVDFNFTNDSPNWLLLETYVYGNELLWKFYSTSYGRNVQWSRDISNEVEAPKPLYKENRDLKKGEIKQVDYEADGMTVVIYRTVTRGDDLLHQDTIRTRYLPWRAIYEYGPGTKLPKDAETE